MQYLNEPGLKALWKKITDWTRTKHGQSIKKGTATEAGIPLNLMNGADTPAALGDTVTITKADITALGIPGSNTEYSDATQSAHGLMSAADKKKLDGVAEGANKYVHPTSAAGAKASGLYKVATDAQGHVTSATSVTKSDITALGIPGSQPNVPEWVNNPMGSDINLDAGVTGVSDGATVSEGMNEHGESIAANAAAINALSSGKADKNSPTFTGTPKAPTAAAGTNTTQIATTAFVHSEVAAASTGAAKYQGGMTAKTYEALTTYKQGWYWVVTEAGTIAGESCEVGDMVFCNTDKAAAGTKKDSHFDIVQNNIDAIPLSVINALS